MEVAQFGDTEIKVNDLKNTFEKLRRTENGKDKCKMEEDFEVNNTLFCIHLIFNILIYKSVFLLLL